MLVEVCSKTHIRLAYLERHKLIEVLTRHFWHPAIDKIVGDFVHHSLIVNCTK